MPTTDTIKNTLARTEITGSSSRTVYRKKRLREPKTTPDLMGSDHVKILATIFNIKVIVTSSFNVIVIMGSMVDC